MSKQVDKAKRKPKRKPPVKKAVKRKARNVGSKPSTKVEHEKRIGLILDMLLLGIPRREILQLVTNPPIPKDGEINPIHTEVRKWRVKTSSIDKYIREARDKLEDSGAFSKDEEIGKAIQRLNDLYRRSYDEKDYKTCLLVQKELSELTGGKVFKVEHSGSTAIINIVDAKDAK